MEQFGDLLFMRIRLTRKLANTLNGADLRQFSVGQVVEVSDSLARMLIAEHWAEGVVSAEARSTADERPRRQTTAAAARSVRRPKSLGRKKR